MSIKRVYFLLGVAVLVVLLGLGLRAYRMEPQPTAGAEIPESAAPKVQIGGPFDLVDQEGDPISDADFRGRHMLMFFGYTYCPDVCPTELTKIGAAVDLLGEDGLKVQPLFITIDPERDTPEQLRMYVTHFHPALMGLTGTPEQIEAVKKAYKVYSAKVPEEGGDPDAYTMDHSALTILMGPDGGFEAAFNPSTTAEALARKIQEFL